MSNTREPTANRVPQDDGTYKTLKMNIGKERLESSHRDFQKLMYGDILINGASYCRRHLMICCHLCQEDRAYLHEALNEERERLGQRMGGDPSLNERSIKWSDLVDEKI